jgi:hypothetical protein
MASGMFLATEGLLAIAGSSSSPDYAVNGVRL